MLEAGCDLHFDLTQLAVMFLSGIIGNLRTFFKLIRDADRFFSTDQVDAVVLIDYPGFNWWIARKAKKNGVPVFYYGVPQMWAWAPWRIGKVRKFVDHVICKLPFEKKWFEERGCDAFYVGHPYYDQLNSQTYDQQFIEENQSASTHTVLLLPGSRKIELDRNLNTLVSVVKKTVSEHVNVRFVIGCLNEEHRTQARREFELAGVDCEIFANRTQELMRIADSCVACSGSVSLELLHHRLPTVIVYRLSVVIYLLLPVLLKCRFITLTNLMMTHEIRKKNWWPYDPDAEGAEPVLMPEYIYWWDCSDAVANQILNWINSDSQRESKVVESDAVARRFAIPGATARAADYILSRIGAGAVSRAAA